MKNIGLIIEYDGSEFHGWQRQPDSPTIQALIEDHLTEVTGKKVVVYGASRTDSGVHAEGQVAHFTAPDTIPAERWRAILNFRLPSTIRILHAEAMKPNFHAQKLVLSKIYDYRILNRHSASALDRRVLFYPKPLRWDLIREAVPLFLGEHDFKAFQNAKSAVQSSIRCLLSFELFEDYKGLYRFRIEGTGFLKQMVRTIMGTLLEIGEGKRDPKDVTKILASRDRRLAGRTVSGSGLCLVSVRYPLSFEQYRI